MKPVFIITAVTFFSIHHICTAQAPGEFFAPKRLVNTNNAAGRFRHPFAMVMGPNDSLWVTERRGFVIRVNSSNGNKKTLLNITGKVKFTTSGSGSSLSIAQDGVFGIALHPDLNKGKGKDYVYLAYCYDSSGLRRTRIVRYDYKRSSMAPFGDTLMNETILLKGIYGSNDHNGGRLVIGNFGSAATPDYKLIYSVGDKGANQFANACDSIEAQYLPTAAQLAAGDIHRYNGKILRLNLDGSIPSDNPLLNGVRSHIWSYGHRNPQGLSFARDNNNALIPKGKLYSSEQGPACDDEVNIIDSANNYGWPRIAGKRDNVWYKYYQWSSSGSCGSYGGECSSAMTNNGLTEFSFTHPRLKDPIFDMYPGVPPGGAACDWLSNPTVAPSSIVYYPYANKIPGWQNCLLVTTLKTSSVYRLKLNAAGNNSLSVSDSIIQYFRDVSALNRFRDIVIGNDGITLYLLTDSVGATSGPSGNNAAVTDRGSILEYKYTGPVLAINEDGPVQQQRQYYFKAYPNPVSKTLFVENRLSVAAPFTYILFETTGKAVVKGSSVRNKFEINVQHFRKGIYILKLYTAYGSETGTQKIIIQ
ncbi:MAG: PQQ-dependent sugar dehydrogenase [Ferruginibacter sp.]